MTLRYTSNGEITPLIVNHMEGRGHFHVTGISAPGEKPSVSFGQGTGWLPASVSLLLRKKILHPLSITKPRFLDHPVPTPAVLHRPLGVPVN